MFTTAATFDGNHGGLAGADSRCQSAATGSALEGTFYAWMSSPTEDAADHLAGDGPWYLARTETLAFTDRASLREGPLELLQIDGRGQPLDRSVNTSVWTGTGADGLVAADTCRAWTRNVRAEFGTAGDFTSTDRWSDDGTVTCETQARLYCFGE